MSAIQNGTFLVTLRLVVHALCIPEYAFTSVCIARVRVEERDINKSVVRVVVDGEVVEARVASRELLEMHFGKEVFVSLRKSRASEALWKRWGVRRMRARASLREPSLRHINTQHLSFWVLMTLVFFAMSSLLIVWGKTDVLMFVLYVRALIVLALMRCCENPRLYHLLERADTWSRAVWTKASVPWAQRKQDLVYRQLVSRPALETLLREELTLQSSLRLCESGCGDGSEAVFVQSVCDNIQARGTLLAYDALSEQEPCANPRVWGGRRKHYLLVERRTRDYIFARHQGDMDMVISSYVLHDVADVEGYVRSVAELLRGGGVAVFTIVHPCFVGALCRKGVVKENKALCLPGRNWESALLYPIAEQAGTFYVPLFHRSEDWYRTLLANYFCSVEERPLCVKKADAEQCAKDGTLPFCAGNNNPYYPEIKEKDSSLLFVCRKQQTQ